MIGLCAAHDSHRPHGRRGLLLRIRRRQGANAAGLLMFVAGFIVAPCLHTIHHRDDHEHGADGSVIVRATGGEAAASFAAGTEDARRDAVSGNRRHTHGQGSLAHFGAALATPALFVVPPAPTSFEELARPNRPRNPVVRRWQHAIFSRGPPIPSA
jgi:hypothetical protein